MNICAFLRTEIKVYEDYFSNYFQNIESLEDYIKIFDNFASGKIN